MKTMQVRYAARVTTAARMCGISKQTLQAAIKRGEIPCAHDASEAVMVRIEDVRKWMQIPQKPGKGRPRKW